MGNIEKFYENTKNGMPHDNIKKFIEMNTRNGNAIDLGCGAGRDTIFLIKNNWNVIAIDREDTKDIIEISLNAEELKKFKPSLEVEEIEDSIGQGNTVDVVELINQIINTEK